MSDIKYGLISQTDARTLEKTIDLIAKEWHDEIINILEIGLYNCQTSDGIMNYIWKEHVLNVKHVNYTGIDNNKDKLIDAPDWMNFINGNSNEVYNQIPDESQHLIFFDGGHAYPTVISDWYCYMNKIKRGGFAVWHDTGKHVAKKKDWQRMGSEDDEDMYISVRKALNKIGLLNDYFDTWSYRLYESISRFNWQLIFDEADETNEAGGICVFKKLY